MLLIPSHCMQVTTSLTMHPALFGNQSVAPINIIATWVLASREVAKDTASSQLGLEPEINRQDNDAINAVESQKAGL